MSSVALVFKLGQQLARKLETDWKSKQQAWVQRCTLEAGQVGTTIGIAYLSATLGREPFEECCRAGWMMGLRSG